MSINSQLAGQKQKVVPTREFLGAEILSNPVINYEAMQKTTWFVYHMNNDEVVLLELGKNLPNQAHTLIIRHKNYLKYNVNQKIAGMELVKELKSANERGTLLLHDIKGKVITLELL